MPYPKTRHLDLYRAIKARGEWITRPELAKATGKRQLSPNDKDRLAELVKGGYIEEEQFVIASSVFYRYRIPEGAPVLPDSVK